MNGLNDTMLESYLNSLRYAEVVIKYKGQRYHIEAGTKKIYNRCIQKESI